MLMEKMRYSLLFLRFIGLAIEDAVWEDSVFPKNRDRLLEHQVIKAFFTDAIGLADKQGLLSREHFSVDGTLIQARASRTTLDLFFAIQQTAVTRFRVGRFSGVRLVAQAVDRRISSNISSQDHLRGA